MPLGYTITEYELPTPSGAEDYSWRDLKAKIWQNLGISAGSEPFSMEIPLKLVQSPRHPQKSRLQICRAIIFDPRGSWKLIFGDCVAQGHSLKSWEAIFDFSIFSPKTFRFLKIRHLKNRKFRPIIGFPIVTKTRKSAQKCNFRFFGVPNNPVPTVEHPGCPPSPAAPTRFQIWPVSENNGVIHSELPIDTV